MATLFDSKDWSVENAPVVEWGHNSKGTFYIVIVRTSPNGKTFNWTMNIPEFQVGDLPNILDGVEHVEKLRFSGGWTKGQAAVKLDLVD